MKMDVKYYFWMFPFVLGLIIAVQSLVLSDLSTGISALSWEAISDLVIFLPVSVYFLWQMSSGLRNSKKMSIWFWVLLGLYVVGVGVHLSANQIHNFIDTTGASTDVAQVVYIWDELIGHWLIHLGLAGVLWLLAFFDNADIGSRTFYGITGFILGLFLAVASIEGHSVWIYVGYSLALWLIMLGRPITNQRLYFLMSSVGVVILLIGWWIAWGSFIELSVLLS